MSLISSSSLQLSLWLATGLALSRSVIAGPGDTDTTFGLSGNAQMPTTKAPTAIYSLDLQGSGAIIGLGAVDDSTPSRFALKPALMRWLSDGRIDTSFGSGGLSLPNIGGEMKVLADGKILLVDREENMGATSALVVQRFLTQGGVDLSFGVNGKQTLLPTLSTGFVGGIHVLQDGRILVAGNSDQSLFLTRLSANGLVDTTFGSNGVDFRTSSSGSLLASAITTQADGRILVVGTINSLGVLYPVIVRYLQNGAFDPEFGTNRNGTVTFTSPATFESVAVRGDGQIVIGGGLEQRMLLVQLNPDGSLDANFGNGGVSLLGLGGSGGSAKRLSLLNNGKIVASGSTFIQRRYAVTAGFKVDGTLDTNFGEGGANYHPWGEGTCTFHAQFLQSDGQLLVAGEFGPINSAAARLQRLSPETVKIPVEDWRLTHFGKAANSGTSADAADPDGDGVSNLLEFAFGLDPKSASSRTIPQPQVANGALTMTFAVPNTSVKGLTLSVQAGSGLSRNNWQTLTGTSATGGTRFSYPITGQSSGFMRLGVRYIP